MLLIEADPTRRMNRFRNNSAGYVSRAIFLSEDEKTKTNETGLPLEPHVHDKLLDAVKFYQEFELGEITNKRDYVLLTHDYKGYVSPCDENHHYLVNYSEDGEHTVRRKIGVIHYKY